MEITAKQLKARIDRGEAPVIVDVREPQEWEVSRIPGTQLIPLNELPRRMRELDPNSEIVVHCRSGMRSARAQQFLRANGFKDVKNLKGGILAWAEEVGEG